MDGVDLDFLRSLVKKEREKDDCYLCVFSSGSLKRVKGFEGG